MAVARKVKCDQRTSEGKSERVERVGVLRAAVDEDHLRVARTPAKSAELTQSVDRDEESLHARNLNIEAPLVDVFVEEREFVIGIYGHAPQRTDD